MFDGHNLVFTDEEGRKKCDDDACSGVSLSVQSAVGEMGDGEAKATYISTKPLTYCRCGFIRPGQGPTRPHTGQVAREGEDGNVTAKTGGESSSGEMIKMLVQLEPCVVTGVRETFTRHRVIPWKSAENSSETTYVCTQDGLVCAVMQLALRKNLASLNLQAPRVELKGTSKQPSKGGPRRASLISTRP